MIVQPLLPIVNPYVGYQHFTMLCGSRNGKNLATMHRIDVATVAIALLYIMLVSFQ